MNFTPSNPTNDSPLGVALLAGRLVGTIIGTDGHITVRAWAKKRNENGRWVTSTFDDAYLIDLSVPGADGDFADKIATWYPAHSSSKWAGRFFVDRAQSDERRIKAAQYLLDVAAGLKNGAHVEMSKRCLRCSKELTHPDSIESQFGPECIKHVGGFMNRSGTPEGAHVPKARTAPTVDEKKGFEEVDDDGLDHLIETLHEGELKKLAIQERMKRNVERDEKNGELPRGQFVPPKPDFERPPVDDTPKPTIDVDETFVARLRAGDDPKQVLAELDAR